MHVGDSKVCHHTLASCAVYLIYAPFLEKEGSVNFWQLGWSRNLGDNLTWGFVEDSQIDIYVIFMGNNFNIECSVLHRDS